MSNGNGAPHDDGATPDPPPGYEEKFADFIRMCDEAESEEVEMVIVDHPRVLGDTYEEIIESLSRLADAALGLQIVSR